MSGVNIVCVLDSVTFGYMVTTPWPSRLATLLGGGYTVTNAGVNGRTILAANSNAAAEVQPHFDAGASLNLVVVIGGTNDVLASDSSATIMGHMATYDTTLQGFGFTVIHCTIPNLTPGGGFDAVQVAYASAIRSTYPSAYVVDLLADSRLANGADTAYFQGDQIHPLDAGDAAIASDVQSCILALVAGPGGGGSDMAGRVYTVPISAVVSPGAAFDFFEFNPASAKPIELLRIRLGQTSEPTSEEEQLRITVKRAQSTSGSGGSAPTPAPLNSTNTAAGFAAETMNTTVATGGSPVTLFEDAMNIRAGYDMAFAPEEVPEAVNGERLVVTCSAPADAITFSGTAWIKERG